MDVVGIDLANLTADCLLGSVVGLGALTATKVLAEPPDMAHAHEDAVVRWAAPSLNHEILS